MHFPPLRFRWFHGANGTSFVPCFETFCRSLACNLAGWVVASNVWIPFKSVSRWISGADFQCDCEWSFVKGLIFFLEDVLCSVLWKCWDPTMFWNQSFPKKHQWGVRRNSACHRPRISQTSSRYTSRDLASGEYVVPYPTVAVKWWEELFSCADVLVLNWMLICVCFRLVAENIFLTNLSPTSAENTFLRGIGMIIIVAWLYCLLF